MAATLWTPNFQVSLKKVHKTGKQGNFEKYLKRLRKKTSRGGIAYFLEFSTLKSFFYYFAFETKGGQLAPHPIGKRVNNLKTSSNCISNVALNKVNFHDTYLSTSSLTLALVR